MTHGSPGMALFVTPNEATEGGLGHRPGRRSLRRSRRDPRQRSNRKGRSVTKGRLNYSNALEQIGVRAL